MANLPKDPILSGGIEGYGKRLRSGKITAQKAVETYLERIAILNPKLDAFEYVAEKQALSNAIAIDSLLQNGVDLGPLMGVPIAVKDLIAVDHMPTTAGSFLDVTDIIGPEGSFVKNLKRCGCIIIGKTTCVEFAFGTLGINKRRTPWNPWDSETHRIPGGSSSGSGVATAAGLCAFSIGTDTGGSVRLPAGLCGTFGIRTNPEIFPTDGVFPLVSSIDTIGPLTKSAADAAVVISVLTGSPKPKSASIKRLKLGKPEKYFYDYIDSDYHKCITSVIEDLENNGAEIITIDVPEAREREHYFPTVLPTYALATLSRERFEQEKDKMDPIVAARCQSGANTKAVEFIQAEQRRLKLCTVMHERMEGFDGWITPTMGVVAPAVTDFDDLDKSMELTVAITQATQPGSLFGQCGISSPIQKYGSKLPVGLQILFRAEDIFKALSVGLAIEQITGLPPIPDMEKFV